MIRYITFTRKMLLLKPRKCTGCGDEFVHYNKHYCQACTEKARPWKPGGAA